MKFREDRLFCFSLTQLIYDRVSIGNWLYLMPKPMLFAIPCLGLLVSEVCIDGWSFLDWAWALFYVSWPH